MKNERINDEFTRKRKLRQRKIRRRRIKIFLFFLTVMLIAVLAVLSVTVFFPIEQITVSGSEKYTAEQILEAANIKKGDNLLRAKADADVLNKKLPYIEKTEISRKLPGTLKIKVKDAAEYACFKADDKYYAVSEDWHILNCYDEAPEGCLIIIADGAEFKTGADVQYKDDKSGKLIENIKELADKYNMKLDRIDVTDELDIKIKTDGRFIVEFGTSNSLENKFAHFEGMIKNIDQSKTGTVNLSMWSASNTEGSFVEGAVE